ncbi:MAG: DedA family protein [Actinomycetota bacterium]|nr:DedA family protein [Actinomycetota bacterium]
MSDLLAYLGQWAVDVVYSFGYVGLGVLMGLVHLHVLPVPTQLILGLAGFLIGQGHFSLVLVLAAAATGAVGASVILYSLGLLIGEERLRKSLVRFERFKLVYVEDLDKASKAFERHGGKAILIGHLVPGVGALISIPAGIKRMSVLKQFVPYTILGSTLWNLVFIVLGLALGAQWEAVKEYTSVIEYGFIAIMAGALLWFLSRRWKRYR